MQYDPEFARVPTSKLHRVQEYNSDSLREGDTLAVI